VWAHHEYEKLREYDQPTMDQPMATFHCHATPEELCHGWAVVHSGRGHEFDLLALRVWPPEGGIPAEVVPLWPSGNEAADYGQEDIETPSVAAVEVSERLVRKYPRLRRDDEDDEDGGFEKTRRPITRYPERWRK
jgi:hypothetical protein